MAWHVCLCIPEMLDLGYFRDGGCCWGYLRSKGTNAGVLYRPTVGIIIHGELGTDLFGSGKVVK